MAMEWSRLLSSKRLRDDKICLPEDGRSQFQKDYDRVIFSRAFRRLQGKTQVHPIPGNDHVHTRLTHTLEVASVGRTLGTRVGSSLARSGKLPNEVRPEDVGSIVQAACLAHDIGNPPFGHAGEAAISAWFQKHQEYLSDLAPEEKLDVEYFEGNAQGLRVLTQLEGYAFDGGLRQTFATLGAFIKYPWSSAKRFGSPDRKKFGFFNSEMQIMGQIADELGLLKLDSGLWVRHPLVYLVECADDICYRIHDLEDAVEIGILNFAELEDALNAGLSETEKGEYDEIPAKNTQRRTSFVRGKLFEYLIRQTVSAFEGREAEILSGTFKKELVNDFEDKAQEILKTAKSVAEKRIFTHSRKAQIEIGAYSIVDVLLTAFCDAVVEHRKRRPSFKAVRAYELLGEDAPGESDDLYLSLMRVTDFVSGMTDQYAVYLSRQLNGTGF